MTGKEENAIEVVVLGGIARQNSIIKQSNTKDSVAF